jgi:hypothetical protein
MPTFEIAALVLIVAVGWFWFDGIKAREIAMAASRRACDSEGLQFLDDTVSINKIGLERDDDGVLRLRRVYGFEFSDTGDNRCSASVVMLGQRVLVLNLELPVVPRDRMLH